MNKYNYWCDHDFWLNVRSLGVIYFIYNNTYQWKYSIQFFTHNNYCVPKFTFCWSNP